MKEDRLIDLYLNWKGLACSYTFKKISGWILIIITILFIYLSYKNNTELYLVLSLIVVTLQIISNKNNKEYYLKYKEIYEAYAKNKGISKYRELLIFLDRVSSINAVYKFILIKYHKNEIKEIKEKYSKS
ncbi:MAG: hypothetical protein ACMXX9_02390 [Candidatus Woesearchaeota archaeon]